MSDNAPVVRPASRKSLLKRRKAEAKAAGFANPSVDEIVFSDTPGIIDDGNFSHGVCHMCDWRGAGRRSREKARRDAAEHYLTAH